jgi:hypothetical protein
MGGWLLVALGFVAFPVAWALLYGAITASYTLGSFMRRRPAGPFLSITLTRIEELGRRISVRPLLATGSIRGRSWAVVIFKEGPNEPCAADPPIKRPFTEPLDDPEEETL